jgi:histone H3/H4
MKKTPGNYLYKESHTKFEVIYMVELQAAGLSRIIRKAGAERVSAEATKIFREYVEKYGTELAEEAIEMAKHAGRKTVKSEDIKLAYQRISR